MSMYTQHRVSFVLAERVFHSLDKAIAECVPIDFLALETYKPLQI